MRGTTGTAQIGTRSSGKVMLLMLSPTCSGMSMVAGQPSFLFMSTSYMLCMIYSISMSTSITSIASSGNMSQEVQEWNKDRLLFTDAEEQRVAFAALDSFR